MNNSYKKCGKIGFISLVCVLISIWICSISGAFGIPLKTNDIMPDIELPTPAGESYRNYLGLSEGEKFFLEDIQARFLIIQIYTMY